MRSVMYVCMYPNFALLPALAILYTIFNFADLIIASDLELMSC